MSERGDQLDRLIRAELPLLYRVAKHLVSSAALAEDLVGATLFKACRAFPQYDGRHPRAWLIKILRNEANQHFRKRSTTEVELDDAEIGHTPHPEAGYFKRLELSQILETMQTLSADSMMILVLCDIEELPYSEVADALEIPIGTVASRLRRARLILKDKLERQGFGGDLR